MSEDSIAQTESKIWACPHGCGYHIADGPAPDGEPTTGELIAEHLEEHAEQAVTIGLPPAACGCPVRYAQEVRGDPWDTLVEHRDGCPGDEAEPEPVDPARAAYTQGLREIADWLDAHPEVKLPHIGAHIPGCELPSLPIWIRAPYKWDDDQRDARARLAEIARAMGRANKGPGLVDGTFIVWRQFAGLAVFAQTERDEVCEKVVTGVREETVEVPDPEALAAVPKVTVTRTVEDFGWICSPLLAEAKS